MLQKSFGNISVLKRLKKLSLFRMDIQPKNESRDYFAALQYKYIHMYAPIFSQTYSFIIVFHSQCRQKFPPVFKKDSNVVVIAR